MAPKSPKKNMMEETIADMAKQLKTLTTTIQGNNTRMDSLEMLIKGLSAENKDLKKELVARDEEIFDLKSRINNMDQRHRSWSTRIFNIPLSKEEEGDNFQVPGAADKPKPVIARFFSRNIRAIVFRGKKEHAPRLAAERQSTRNTEARPGKFAYPIYEDLTAINYGKLKELNTSEKTSACWTTNGLIRYKLVGDDTVYRVKSVFDTANSILANN